MLSCSWLKSLHRNELNCKISFLPVRPNVLMYRRKISGISECKVTTLPFQNEKKIKISHQKAYMNEKTISLMTSTHDQRENCVRILIIDCFI